MSADRLDQLKAMLTEEPGDSFLRYAIALEHKRLGDFDAAIDALQQLLGDLPGHVPSYYQLALMLGELGKVNEAVQICDAGVQQCLNSDDRKARAELLELRNTLLDEE